MSSDRNAPSSSQGLRVNEQIRISPLRVIDHNGAMLGIISRDEAMELARQQDMDLVEVAATERPPVCKIMDYGKYKFEQTKKTKKGQSQQMQIKEIRVRPRCAENDLETKIRHAREFLAEKDKVMVTVQFRGRENAHAELGMDLVKAMIEKLSDVAKVERAPMFESKRITAVLAPR